MEEEWRDIKGYEGYYQVSNLGRIRSLDRIILKINGHTERRKGQLMSQVYDKDGYLTVGLRKDRRKITYGVHRLVANAFIQNPYNLPEVNHKDENKENNNIDNLEWCTTKYNINYGTAIDRRTLYDKTRPILVYQYNNFIREYENINALCDKMNIDKSIFNGHNQQVYFKYNDNYLFVFKDNFEKIPRHIDFKNIRSKKSKYMVTYDMYSGKLINIYMDLHELTIKLNKSIHTLRRIADTDKHFENMLIRGYYEYNDIKEKIDIPKVIDKRIFQYDLKMNLVNEWMNAKEASLKLGYDHSAICKCARGEQEVAYGYIWKKVDKVLNCKEE